LKILARKQELAMDKLVEKLLATERTKIVEVMAFMAYNPSIGRVLEKDGVKKFRKMAVRKIKRLSSIQTREAFDRFHASWANDVERQIRTNSRQGGRPCSYGQAQKPINVFLKLYVDWAKLPDRVTADRVVRYLHVPLDSILMGKISRLYQAEVSRTIPVQRRTFPLTEISQETYDAWQRLFRSKYRKKPLLFDILWATERLEAKRSV
jgi:hypothetical protein